MLLLKDDIGRAKPSTYDLPDERFAYGRPGNHDAEGAREVSMFWVSHTPSPAPRSTAPDFVLFNKRAASAGVHKATELARYRKDTDRTTPRYGDRRSPSARGVIPSDLYSTFTYGKKVRPSTPIDEVISNRFGERANQSLDKHYSMYREDLRHSTNVRKITTTVASRGHAIAARKAIKRREEEKKDEKFKLGRFKNITTKIDNRRKLGLHAALLGQLLAEDMPSTLEAQSAPPLAEAVLDAGEAETAA